MKPASGRRRFGALVEHEGIYLLEYEREKSGLRVVNQWVDRRRADSVDAAVTRLVALIQSVGARNASIAVALQHFGVFHHIMMLPGTTDDVVRPVIRREVQRVFGVADPVVAFTRGDHVERRDADRADPKTAPRQLFIGGGPSATIDAVAEGLNTTSFDVDGITVVPEAIRRVFESRPRSAEPTAVLVCLSGGPHLCFFIDGRLELAIEPPIALEGERVTDPAIVVDQVERGGVFLRQQFRGAQATELLLAAAPDSYDGIAAAIEARTAMRVQPFTHDLVDPEAVVVMGAVLNAQSQTALDLYPHPPTLESRLRANLTGRRGVAVGLCAAAALALLWVGLQVNGLAAARRDSAALQTQITRELPSLTPIRDVATKRAGYAQAAAAMRDANARRTLLSGALAALAGRAPPSVTFDSIGVTGSADGGWTGAVVGRITGPSAADAIRALDAFYRSSRRIDGFSHLDLEPFDYPAAPPPDSTAPVPPSRDVTLQFRMTFALAAKPVAH